ncbi:MAG: hypothetical protein K8I30_20760 [Anaerolineae bacterium]|nr:hypothetical protein [Anaerolineae bacterium]
MPDTGAYLILGLAVTLIIMTFFIASMVARWRSLQKDLRLLDELEQDEQSA